MPTLPFILDNLSRLAARGYQYGAEYSSGLAKRGDEPPKFPQMPGWGIAIIAFTALFALFFLISIQYTIGDVISTLAMIETPAAEVTFIESSDEPDNTLDKEQKEPLLEQAPTVAVTPIKPITSSIRGTLKHLTAQAGRRSRWRGIVPAIVYSMAAGVFFNLFEALIPRGFPARLMLVNALSALPIARLHMAWTHALISMPSSLRWYQRIAPLSTYKQLWLPTIVANTAAVYAVYAIGMFAYLIAGVRMEKTMDRLNHGHAISGGEVAAAVASVIGIFVFAIFVGLFVVLPAHVTLVRVEASLLPEDQDTIVPFDRSFGGKVQPAVLGGKGISMIEAWKSFNWEARRRIIKLQVKSAIIQIVTIFTFVHLIAFEALAIMGKDIRHYMCQMRRWAKEHPAQVHN